MITYILRRLFLIIPTFFGVSVSVFLLTQAVPGGPVDEMISRIKFSETGGRGANSAITEEYRQQLNEYYGFNKPITTRYWIWIKNFATLDFGDSYFYGEPVRDLIIQKLPVSLTFGIWSFLLIYLLSIPLGIFKGIHENSYFDTLSSIFLFMLYSIPSFALAILFIVLLCGGSFLNLFPLQGLHADNASSLSYLKYVTDYLWHATLPITCYVIGLFAPLTMLMKNSFINQISQDYVRTARAKGLSQKKVYFKHVLRNALIPIATGVGTQIGLFLSGSILIEQIFGLDGIGLLTYNSVISRDYPVVLAIIMLAAVTSMIGNLISDILYVIIDPRIDFGEN